MFGLIVDYGQSFCGTRIIYNPLNLSRRDERDILFTTDILEQWSKCFYQIEIIIIKKLIFNIFFLHFVSI